MLNNITFYKIEGDYIYPFLDNSAILYTLKTPENQRFSDVSRENKMVTLARNGLNKLITGLAVCWIGTNNVITTVFRSAPGNIARGLCTGYVKNLSKKN